MPGKDYAQIMWRVLKRKITHNHVPKGRCASIGLPGPANWRTWHLHPKPTCSYHAPPTDCCRVQTFEAWLERNVPKFTGLFEAEPICSRQMSNRLAQTSATNHVAAHHQNQTKTSPLVHARSLHALLRYGHPLRRRT